MFEFWQIFISGKNSTSESRERLFYRLFFLVYSTYFTNQVSRCIMTHILNKWREKMTCVREPKHKSLLISLELESHEAHCLMENLRNFIQRHIFKTGIGMIKRRRSSYGHLTCGRTSFFSFSESPEVCFKVSSRCYKIITITNFRSV